MRLEVSEHLAELERESLNSGRSSKAAGKSSRPRSTN